MKKFLALLAAAAILLTLGGCSLKKEKTALVISGTDIGMETYNYYYDLVRGRPGDYGLSDSPKEKDIKEAAIALCRRYIALNSSFVVHKLSLSATDKINISDKVNNHWMRFENHYDKIGVSKQTLYKIFTSETYEDVIFSAMYDKGVSDKAQEKKIKQYFYSEYAAFRSVCVYFTGSDGKQEMTEAEKQKVMTDMNEIARDSDETAESFISTCSAKGYTASDVVVIKRDSDGYPAGFFDSIYDQTDNSVKIIAYGDCVFAVQKANLESLGEGLYAGYRSVLIKDMYAGEWQKTLNSYIDTFTVDEKNV
ncbi:MAG: hypothetical protein IKN56_04995 [Clostridia bacterium]|nr:hypothetical protein [Clostridia bacterium]MBR6360205.1 hypothetical protein [Clostridia bacterium]